MFYGHGFGAIVAYELARRLQAEGARRPWQLVVSGAAGPHLYVVPNAHRIPTAKLLELLRVAGYPHVDGLEPDDALFDERVERIRADWEAMATYHYREGDLLQVPITAISLRHDLMCFPLRVDGWAFHTSAGYDIREWSGDHYRFVRHPEQIDEIIRSVFAGLPALIARCK